MDWYMRRIAFSFVILTLVECGTTRESVASHMANEIGAAQGKLRRKTVAVIPLEMRGLTNSSQAQDFIDLLTHELVSSTPLQVVERTKLNAVLGEQRLALTGAIDEKTAARVGRLLSVDAVIIGSIDTKPENVDVFLRLVDSETALILKTAHGVLPKEKTSTKVAASTPVSGAIDTQETQNIGALEHESKATGRIIDLSYKSGGTSGYHQVIGRVENTSAATLLKSVVSLRHYDSAGDFVASSPCVSPDQPILKKQKLPFSCLFKPSKDFKHFEAVLDTDGNNFSSKTLNLSAQKIKFRKDDSILRNYQLNGIIRNNSGGVIRYPSVLVSLFDATGKFIGSARGFAAQKELRNGQTSPFSVNIYEYSLQGKPARFEAFYSAILTRQ